MPARLKLTHQFVEFIPDKLLDGVLYVSIAYATVAHTCCCGCGHEVVTPLTPTDWKLAFDGETVTLDPSIGNRSFPCQSHHWIRRNRVQWADRWTPEQIQAGRDQDAARRGQRPNIGNTPAPSAPVAAPLELARPEPTLWRKLRDLFRGG